MTVKFGLTIGPFLEKSTLVEYNFSMVNDPALDPAPEEFRSLFNGQALMHLDEIVLSWRTGGHPISWDEKIAFFEVWLTDGPQSLFKLHAPGDDLPARIEVDVNDATRRGFSAELASKLWDELAYIGNQKENTHAPVAVSLAKFSRGDRKVFLAYALTIARILSRRPDGV